MANGIKNQSKYQEQLEKVACKYITNIITVPRVATKILVYYNLQ